ncbi:hypothetical protein Rhopal_006984-T1 [Rhodotorula paludigena]|uniref:BAR domain-containing protein n=1 Tax=Rhodotorula paludigena TaxID=86838 RepID=A0AAV5GVG2_9BASI|nr:hypothetical protein Rhopal_006984-T1 [Rhodotorula paludigena]
MQRLKQSLSSLPTPSIPSFSSSPGDKTTPPPLDPELLASLSARRELASNVQATFSLLVHHLSKQRPSPVSGRGNATDLAVRWFGDELVKGAEELQDSRYSLRHVGEMSQQHAQLATAYHDQLAMGFLEPVEARAAEYKDLFKDVKEAEKKRSTLESVMAKMEKGKKDPAEFEREFDQAEWAYQDDCSRLRRRAEQLESTLQDDVDALRQLVEVQLGATSLVGSRVGQIG